MRRVCRSTKDVAARYSHAVDHPPHWLHCHYGRQLLQLDHITVRFVSSNRRQLAAASQAGYTALRNHFN